VEKHIRHLLAGIEKLLDPKFDKRAQKLNKIVEYRDNLSRELREDFSRVLAALADRVVQFRNVLRPEDPADARLVQDESGANRGPAASILTLPSQTEGTPPGQSLEVPNDD
jgi:hypothetical protein